MSKGKILTPGEAQKMDQASKIEAEVATRPKTGPPCGKCGEEMWVLETYPTEIHLRCSRIGCGNTTVNKIGTP